LVLSADSADLRRVFNLRQSVESADLKNVCRKNLAGNRVVVHHIHLVQTAGILDCGGKRSATPLSRGKGGLSSEAIIVRAKAVSPLRFATAVQKARLFDLALIITFTPSHDARRSII
jgi:hypothetical protein